MTLPDRSLLYKNLPGEIGFWVTLFVAANLASPITLVIHGYQHESILELERLPLSFCGV